jgi:hypothetical protein
MEKTGENCDMMRNMGGKTCGKLVNNCGKMIGLSCGNLIKQSGNPWLYRPGR